ncbi:MAG: hypothetical protein LBS69_06415, partial [Prevotellaceae bacterium]|nr:hypothetical protein [Prevotellaceae bacterium]
TFVEANICSKNIFYVQICDSTMSKIIKKRMGHPSVKVRKNCRQLARHAYVCVLSINILSLTGQQTSSNLTGFKNLLGLKCLLIIRCV